MGRQGGIARLIGTIAGLNFYFDEDMELVRRRSSLTKQQWLTMPSMRKQREASKLFGAASVIASQLWKGLPAGMRRLADADAYGRLVGHCRHWVGEVEEDESGKLKDEQMAGRGGAGRRMVLWDVDLLKGFNLSRDSVGPHRVKSGGDDGGFRLVGMDRLMAELDAVTGVYAGRAPEKYVVHMRFGGRGRIAV
jgi:hypothetical protein